MPFLYTFTTEPNAYRHRDLATTTITDTKTTEPTTTPTLQRRLAPSQLIGEEAVGRRAECE